MLALAVAIDVAITSLGGARGYELQAGGAQKRGDISGPATITDSIQVADVDASVPVTVRFFDPDGLLSTCPSVAVRVQGGRPACRPRFVLTATQLGYRQYLCETGCDPLPQGGAQ